jgi:hypothetical protein
VIFFCIIEYRDGEKEHQDKDDMCGHAYPEIDNTAKIDREGAAPHKSQDGHNEHPAGGIRDMSERIFTGVKNVLIAIVNPKSEILHDTSLLLSCLLYGRLSCLD